MNNSNNSVHDTDELKELDKTNRRARIVEGVFISVFTLTVLTASITAFGSKTPKLLYMGWFPFNWRNSRFLCNIGNAYQIIAIIYYISINFANDTFVATALCILHGHIKILGKRISKIGEKDKSQNYNEEQLKFCIEIQKVLYLLCDRIQLVVSLTMLVQFTVNATNICLNLAIMLYFSTDNINRIFYFFYLFAVSLQTFPACYYGSKVEHGFEQLRHAAFQSEWIQQNRNYKTCMIIFTERVLKKRTLIAGRLLPIHLDTFFSICKGAYSMLAMIIKLKK
ncbi:odorant receptor 59a-like [Teleopsis dalmanni]|uniref:odorant receptor 59a-like n=1 Tax=Teleopsis dalmanni TaxID=139649 RepID=UPI0018CECB2D|nr:odorant receptor 59a-like [Teleopsis dalmanni]